MVHPVVRQVHMVLLNHVLAPITALLVAPYQVHGAIQVTTHVDVYPKIQPMKGMKNVI